MKPSDKKKIQPSQEAEELSNLFRSVEADLGTTELAQLVLETLTYSLDKYKPKSVDELIDQFKELFLLNKNTQPRISLVIFYFYKMWEEIQSKRENIQSIDDFKNTVQEVIARIAQENNEDLERIINVGVDCIEENDSILVHSHSKTVLRVIERAHKQKKNFRVILAEQEAEKTLDMIQFLDNRKIPFFVVPEFMLSHVEEEVTKAFFGAITLNYEKNFITDAGTNSVISEFHQANKPVYMFISSKKFSLWESEPKYHTYKVMQKKNSLTTHTLHYDRIKFSHDRLPVNYIDYIITEEGVSTPQEIIDIYQKRYQEQVDMRQKFFAEAAPSKA